MNMDMIHAFKRLSPVALGVIIESMKPKFDHMINGDILTDLVEAREATEAFFDDLL